jgi:hypothetical protein
MSSFSVNVEAILMALLHFYIPCALIMAFQFAQKIRGVIGKKIEIDIFLSKWKKLRYFWGRYIILLKKLVDILEIFSQPI